MRAIFYTLYGLVLIGAIGVLFSRNALRSALFFLLSLFVLGIIYITLGSPFLGFIQIIIYAGAVVTLILMVIMTLRLREPLEDHELTPKGYLGFLISAFLSLALIFGFAKAALHFPASGHTFGAADLGRYLLTDYLLPFEVVSLLLLVAIVAAVMLGKRRV